ncbi:MAG: hypothetical protein PSV26_11185 [Polaromonas sp.]|uniref:hypothetical protein n=1 Tax=Polaromonas sp. TaxID=1869339 RepID=UPI002489A76C|nr:hypothetical protein [Polaromonas sp.]MDI1238035.1 hypothetical protein [Polaromonas sp.]MDI1338774.1 hypothetical protein [Polaromonas sp.]
MLFASHVNVSAPAQDEDGQPGKGHEGECDFPHVISPEKTPGDAGGFKKLVQWFCPVTGQNLKAVVTGDQSSA